MANHKSALKRMRQNVKRQERNRAVRSRVRTFVKGARQALESGDVPAAEAAVRATESELAKAARKGVLHKRNAARRASRLARRAAQVRAAQA